MIAKQYVDLTEVLLAEHTSPRQHRAHGVHFARLYQEVNLENVGSEALRAGRHGLGEADECEFAVVEAEAVVVGDQAVKGVLGLDASLALDVDYLKDCIGLSLCKQVDIVLVE